MITLITGCGGRNTTVVTGRVNLLMTDTPIGDENITGVYVTLNALRYQYKDSHKNWQEIKLDEPRTINLLELKDGNYTILNITELPTGEIQHVCFILDKDNCYITFNDHTKTNLQLDSSNGGKTEGYRSINGFVINAGSVTNITADFDVRKSVTVTENGIFKLKPTIRLVNNTEIGEIRGTLNIDTNNSSVIVYVYQDGTWEDNQSYPANDFNNAITSSNAIDGNFTFAWLESGTYDLVVAEYDNSGILGNITKFVPDITVSQNTITTVDITNDTIQDTL
jgi:hypothetical protein